MNLSNICLQNKAMITSASTAIAISMFFLMYFIIPIQDDLKVHASLPAHLTADEKLNNIEKRMDRMNEKLDSIDERVRDIQIILGKKNG